MVGSELPPIVSLFPLRGVLLLPGNLLPLQVFEQRYLNLVEDLLPVEPTQLGMIQPRVESLANDDQPELYSVGCLGRLVQCLRTSDGRYLIGVEGVVRFRCRNELPLRHGYRRVEADYSEFGQDLQEANMAYDAQAIHRALEPFELPNLDVEALRRLPDRQQLNVLAALLPFSADEKQALLEAPALPDRERVLLSLLMSLAAMREGAAPNDSAWVH